MEKTSVTYEDIDELTNAYVDLLIDNIKNECNRLIDLLKKSIGCSELTRKKILNTIKEIKIDEISKCKVKNELRRCIYDFKFFERYDENTIKEYVELYNSIVLSIKEFDYVYLFEDHNILLLNPTPYKNENYVQENKAKIEKETTDKIKEFQEKHLDINILIDYFSKNNTNRFGRKLGFYWNDGEYDDDLFNRLTAKSKTIAKDYIEIISRKEIKPIQNLLKKKYPIDFKVELYKIEANNTKELPLIDGEDDDIKRKFWDNFIFENKDNQKWAVLEAKRYSNFNNYIKQLFFYNHECNLAPNDLYELFIGVEHLPAGNINSDTPYYLSKLLKVLQIAYINDEDKIDQICYLELEFSNLLKFEDMACLKKEMSINPIIYADIINNACIHENNEVKSVDNYTIINLYRKIEFCPCVKENNVDYKELCVWINTFKEALKKNNQAFLANHIIGTLLSNSPIGLDGYYPCESVRLFIEEHHDKEILSGYEIGIFNARGSYLASAGEEETKLANQYNDCYMHLKNKYPYTAKIYKKLRDTYKQEAKRERYEAENR